MKSVPYHLATEFESTSNAHGVEYWISTPLFAQGRNTVSSGSLPIDPLEKNFNGSSSKEKGHDGALSANEEPFRVDDGRKEEDNEDGETAAADEESDTELEAPLSCSRDIQLDGGDFSCSIEGEHSSVGGVDKSQDLHDLMEGSPFYVPLWNWLKRHISAIENEKNAATAKPRKSRFFDVDLGSAHPVAHLQRCLVAVVLMHFDLVDDLRGFVLQLDRQESHSTKVQDNSKYNSISACLRSMSQNFDIFEDIHKYLIHQHQKAMVESEDQSSYESVCAKYILKAKFLSSFRSFSLKSSSSERPLSKPKFEGTSLPVSRSGVTILPLPSFSLEEETLLENVKEILFLSVQFLKSDVSIDVVSTAITYREKWVKMKIFGWTAVNHALTLFADPSKLVHILVWLRPAASYDDHSPCNFMVGVSGTNLSLKNRLRTVWEDCHGTLISLMTSNIWLRRYVLDCFALRLNEFDPVERKKDIEFLHKEGP